MDGFVARFKSQITGWATDVMFKDPRSLASIYPPLVQHAMNHFKSPDVMRFLGKKANGNFTGEIVTSLKNRPEGVRVKHWIAGNSIKMYDKAGSILRFEPPSPSRLLSRSCGPSTTTSPKASSPGSPCARASPISIDAPRSPSAPTTTT